MRIELSDPIAGLMFAVPLIALLMTASRSPVAFRQRSQEGERIVSAHQIARQCGLSRNGNYRFVARRWMERVRPHEIGYFRAQQRWRTRPDAMVACEVFVSCQQMTVMSER
jgi:hypothetical protein